MAAPRKAKAGKLANDYKGDPSKRIPAIDLRAMDILWPVSRGGGLDPAMRLVAMVMLLWDQETTRGRLEWDLDQLSDRTGLSTAQVGKALERLRTVNLVAETAAGPKLTWWEFDTKTKPEWMRMSMLRPMLKSVSTAQQSTPEEA